jgi:hypothetical protein
MNKLFTLGLAAALGMFAGTATSAEDAAAIAEDTAAIAEVAAAPTAAATTAPPAGTAPGACLQPVWREREVKVKVNRLVKKSVPTCECEKKTIWKGTIKDVTGCKWEHIKVCRDVVQEVPVTKQVPVCVTDPCTGCTRTEYREETCVEKVVTKVIETIPVKREYKYKLVSFGDSEEIEVPKTETVEECQPETVITKERYLEWVPVCPPAPAPCDHP